jgi:hypothetical protein
LDDDAAMVARAVSGESALRALRFAAAGLVMVAGLWRVPGAVAWSVESVPQPPVANGQLDAVSCTSSQACIAVGQFTDGHDNPQVLPYALTARWDGHRWSSRPARSRRSR